MKNVWLSVLLIGWISAPGIAQPWTHTGLVR